MLDRLKFYDLRDECWLKAREIGEICAVIGTHKRATGVIELSLLRPASNRVIYWVSFPATTLEEHRAKLTKSITAQMGEDAYVPGT